MPRARALLPSPLPLGVAQAWIHTKKKYNSTLVDRLLSKYNCPPIKYGSKGDIPEHLDAHFTYFAKLLARVNVNCHPLMAVWCCALNKDTNRIEFFAAQWCASAAVRTTSTLTPKRRERARRSEHRGVRVTVAHAWCMCTHGPILWDHEPCAHLSCAQLVRRAVLCARRVSVDSVNVSLVKTHSAA